MKGTFWIGFVLVVIAASCVDRINFDVGDPTVFPVVVEGFITDQPGPYEVKVTKAFDIESKLSIKQPLSVRKIVISDNVGNSEQLEKVSDGIYRTRVNGIHGVVGRAYSMRVELLDGRIYESIRDTMMVGGSVDKIERNLVSYIDETNATAYGFDIFFDSDAGDNTSFQFLWKMVATYKVSTNPELNTEPCGESRCLAPLPCSAMEVDIDGQLVYVRPCECCDCWVDLYNDLPIVSDDQLVKNGVFQHVKAGMIPIDQYTLSYKTHVEIQQFSLTPRVFEFWKSVRAQKTGTTSLFQPLTGKIIGNFEQVGGEPGPLEGIFYASSVKKNSIYLTSADVPDKRIIPVQTLTNTKSCLTFPNSTNVEPEYWKP